MRNSLKSVGKGLKSHIAITDMVIHCTLLVHHEIGGFRVPKLLTRGNIHQKKGNLIKNPNINVTRANPVMRLWDLG